jgi:hypothetical protein
VPQNGSGHSKGLEDLTLKLGHECDAYSQLRKEMGTQVWKQWRIAV